MSRYPVTDCLDRARECADKAELVQGAQRAKLMALADEWLRLAEEASKVANGRATAVL